VSLLTGAGGSIAVCGASGRSTKCRSPSPFVLRTGGEEVATDCSEAISCSNSRSSSAVSRLKNCPAKSELISFSVCYNDLIIK
jgi:hypothetical protein